MNHKKTLKKVASLRLQKYSLLNAFEEKANMEIEEVEVIDCIKKMERIDIAQLQEEFGCSIYAAELLAIIHDFIEQEETLISQLKAHYKKINVEELISCIAFNSDNSRDINDDVIDSCLEDFSAMIIGNKK